MASIAPTVVAKAMTQVVLREDWARNADSWSACRKKNKLYEIVRQLNNKKHGLWLMTLAFEDAGFGITRIVGLGVIDLFVRSKLWFINVGACATHLDGSWSDSEIPTGQTVLNRNSWQGPIPELPVLGMIMLSKSTMWNGKGSNSSHNFELPFSMALLLDKWHCQMAPVSLGPPQGEFGGAKAPCPVLTVVRAVGSWPCRCRIFWGPGPMHPNFLPLPPVQILSQHCLAPGYLATWLYTAMFHTSALSSNSDTPRATCFDSMCLTATSWDLNSGVAMPFATKISDIPNKLKLKSLKGFKLKAPSH